MSRQFRSDDTNEWKEGFGNGSDGSLTYTGGNFGGAVGYGLAIFTGTSGNTYGTFTDGAYFNGSNGGRVGDIIMIHQCRGTGAGKWELNKIASRSGSTLNLEYPLQNTYSAGAQAVSSGSYKDLTFTGTTTVANWNHQIGGIIFLVANRAITVTGTLTADGGIGPRGTYNTEGWYAGSTTGGFNGGTGRIYINHGSTNVAGYRGESAVSDETITMAASAGSGGGGGNVHYEYNWYWSGGGGGGNGTVGTAGDHVGNPGGGAAGGTDGNVALTDMVFGGAGGGGACAAGNSYVGTGSSGAGIIFLMAPTITFTGDVSLDGGDANPTVASITNGGAGAGGSLLIKGETVVLGTNKATAAGGAGQTPQTGGTHAGGVGRIHVDYSKSLTGTTTPTLNSTLDTTIKGISPSMLIMF